MREFRTSCGVFLTRLNPNTDKYEILLIQKNFDTGLGWYLPKGTVEAGETPIQTASRELTEETGVEDFVIVRPIGEYSYDFERDGIHITKTVKWFWGVTKYHEEQKLIKGTTESEKKTHMDTKWHDIESAVKIVNGDSDKDILNKILGLLLN